MLTYQNLLMGSIDLYPEYTGDIVGMILQHTLDKDPAVVFDRAQTDIRQTAGMELLNPLGFESSFVIIVRKAKAHELHLNKISDLERSDKGWTIGVTPAFQERSDGYNALMRSYDIVWSAAPRIVDPGALYPLLAEDRVDMIAGRKTDGALAENGVMVLKDDRDAFPPSQACILVRQGAFAKAPGLRAALQELSGKISQGAMQHMNFEVDVRQRSVRDVAAKFLQDAGL